jgi:hypothetical protein
MRGWVTVEDATGFRVLFVGPVQNKTVAFYEVRLVAGQTPHIADVDPPAPLDAEAEVRFKAVSAVASPNDPNFLLCSKTYNPVVLPASLVGKQGWLVYLLAATTEPKVAVIGGHHRFLMSQDGARVIEHTQLSKACMNLKEQAPDGAKQDASLRGYFTWQLVGRRKKDRLSRLAVTFSRADSPRFGSAEPARYA